MGMLKISLSSTGAGSGGVAARVLLLGCCATVLARYSTYAQAHLISTYMSSCIRVYSLIYAYMYLHMLKVSLVF